MSVVFMAMMALPSPAQRRGGAPAMPSFGARGFAPCCDRGFISPGVSFGRNPRLHVFFGSPFIRREPSFVRRGFTHRRFLFAEPIFLPGPYDYGVASYPEIAEPDQYVERDYDRELGSEIRELREQVGQLRTDLAERESAEPSRAPEEAEKAPQKKGPATELIFRDGHSMEARNYIIVGPTIWVLTEQQAKKIPLSDLDLDATAKTNNERGIEFRLPAKATKK